MGTYGMHVSTLFAWLLKTTVQGSLLICLILLVTLFVRDRLRPKWLCWLWLVLLVRLSIPWAPQSRLSMYGLMQPSRWAGWVAAGREKATADARKSDVKSRAVSTPQIGARSQQTGRADEQKMRESGKSVRDAQPASPAQIDSTETTVGTRATLDIAVLWAIGPALWLIGVLGLGAYILTRSLRLWWTVKSERLVTDQEVLDTLEDAKLQMGIQTILGVVVTDKVRSPALLGFVRPRLLLPEGLLEALSPDGLRHVFLHELAHLKRRDVYIGWWAAILQILHWFNPLIWFAFRRMRADQEMAADALALSMGEPDESSGYGQTIVNLLERFSRPQYLPSLAGILESPSHIERRMTMIAKFKSNSYRWSAVGIGLITVLGAISLIDPVQGAASSSAEASAKPAVTMHQVQMDSGAVYGSTSPDGRYLCGWDTWQVRGEIVIREVATGEERTIRPTKDTPEECGPQNPIMSPDNKTIAYFVARPTEVNDVFLPCDVCLIGTDGSGQRVLYRSAASGKHVIPPILMPVQWFPDGSRILALRRPDPMGASDIEIMSVAIADGSVQVIKKLTGGFSDPVIRLSPDGEYVAYELPSRTDPTQNDIFAIEIGSQRETRLVGHDADDKLLDWTPDGHHILFISDRLGAWGVWLLPVAQGQAQNAPKLVASGTAGDMRPIGFVQNGSYMYRSRAVAADIYTAGINVTTGQLLSAPVPMGTVGFNETVDWSPDGKYIAYGSSGAIRIRTLETGKERELANKLTPFDCVRWSPDGRSLLVSGLRAYRPEDLPLTRRVYRVDAATGETTILLDTKDEYGVGMAELSPDGKTLYYWHLYWQKGIVRRDIATGQEKTIFPYLYNGGWVSWALSPNGEFVVTGSNEGTGQKGPEGWMEGGVKKVLLVPSQGGQPTELVRWDQEPSSYLTDTRWSPDGKTVLFMLHRVSISGKDLKGINELWQVSAGGGEPRKIMETDLGMLARRGFRVHPDGQQIAFPAGVGSHGGLWVMENFLPAAKAASTTTSMATPQRAVVAGSPASQVKAPVSMRLVEKDSTGYASVSPDGKYLCDVNIQGGMPGDDIVLREFATGGKRSIKPTKGTPDESGPMFPLVSPEGKTIVYGAQRDRTVLLCVIGTDGSGQRDICTGVYPIQWFPDGSRILGCQVPNENKTMSIVSVSVSDGSVHKIKTASAGPWVRGTRLSPDARYVAYGLPAEGGSDKQDIFVVEIASEQETPLVQHSADDRPLGWTPDGRHLLFASDRMGSWDAWLLPVADGKAQGVPELVARNLGAVAPKGFTQNGSYFYEVAYNGDDIYTAAIDVVAGRLLSAPEVLPAAGNNGYADWSPDGQSLAYCSYPEPARRPHVIRIRSLATGQERELFHELPMVRCLSWCPDGRSVLASWLTVFGAGQEEWPGRVCRVDVDTGESTVVLQTDSKNGGVWRAELSPDEKTLFYSQGGAVFRRQIAGGEQKSIYDFPKEAEGGWITWALSPTAEFIAVGFNEPRKEAKEYVTSIVVVPSGGGEITELLRRNEPGGQLTAVAWSRDSTTVLTTVQRDFDTIEFWQVPTKGSQPRKITEAKLGWCYSLRVHPDGQRIAFMAGHRRHELWVMENFLPVDKGGGDAR